MTTPEPSRFDGRSGPGGRSVRFGRFAAIGAIWIVAAFSAGSLTLDHDIARMLPDRDPGYERATSFVRHLMARTLIDIATPEARPADPARLAAVADRLAAGLSESPHVRRAGPSVDPVGVRAALDLVRSRCALLVGPESLADLAPRLEADALSQYFRDLERRIQEPDGAVFLDRFSEDPLGIADLALKPLEALTRTFGEVRIERGYVIDATGRHALLFVEPSSPPTDTAGSRAFLEDLEAAIAELRADPASADLVVRHLGAHRSTLDNADQIQRDVRVTSVVGIATIVVFAVLAFSRLTGVLLALLPALFGACFALGVFGLFRDRIVGAVAGFGAVLLAITIDYAIHIIFRLESSVDGDPEPPRPPTGALRIGASTTAVAFLALLASSLPGIREVGVFGGLGTVAAFAFAIVVLPPLLRPPKRRRRPFIDLGRVAAAVRASRFYPWVPVVALIATPGVAIGLAFLRQDGDPRRLSSLSAAASGDEVAIESAWGSVFRVTTVVVEAPTFERALASNETIARRLDRAALEGRIVGHASVAELLPSARTQAKRWAEWTRFFDPDRIARLRSRIATALEETLFDPVAFRDYAWLSERPPPLDATVLEAPGFGRLVQDRVFPTERGFLIATPVFTRDAAQVDALAEELESTVPEATVVDRARLVRQLGGLVVDEAWTIGLVAFLAVVTIVWLWLGRIELVLVIAVPLLLSGVWTLGVLGWLGLPITLANAVFLAFLFGLAVDYAVFLAHSRLERYRTGRDHARDADASVLFCATTTGVGFGALALAGHPVLFSIGSTALVGIVCAALSTQIFVPLLCGLVLRRPGPNGAFAWRYAWPSFCLLAALIGRASGFLLRSPFIRDRRAREREALRCIQGGAFWVRDRLAIGRREYVGIDPEKFETPCVVVANHQSHYDNLALAALPIPLQFLIKPWVSKLPIVGRLVAMAGYRVIREGDADDLAAAVRERAAAGVSTASYPEGTRTRSGRMGRFHNGPFALARAADLDILPVALVNTRSAVRPGTWWVADHATRVVVLDRVHPRDYEGDLADRRMARAVRDRIREACDEHWLATQSGPGWERRIEFAYRYLDRSAARRARATLRADAFLGALPELVDGSGVVLFVGLRSAVHLCRLASVYPQRAFVAIECEGSRIAVARAVVGDATCRFVSDPSDVDAFESVRDVILLDGPPARSPEGPAKESDPAQIVEACVRGLSVGARVWFREDDARAGFPGFGDSSILRDLGSEMLARDEHGGGLRGWTVTRPPESDRTRTSE